MAIAAIAKRRKLLNDEILIALAESSWEILDISASNVSDVGLSQVVNTCKALQAVDIRLTEFSFLADNINLLMLIGRFPIGTLLQWRYFKMISLKW